ncbi:MAG TPA: DUF3592 domain-containing protein [Steroidobacteraceae bacterium]|jgi:hypothetical protein|nr:DUF3592 domain-containing protein [Steroidobacteraceae bacterium]
MRLAFGILDLAARLLFALGIGCLLLGGWLSWQTLSFARDAAPATGEVVSYHEIRDGGQVRQTPRVRFRTGTGEIVTIDGQLATSSRRYAIGAQVPMLYKVSQPTTARVATFTDNWLGGCIAAVIGAVGMIGGVLVRRQVKRELKKMPA